MRLMSPDWIQVQHGVDINFDWDNNLLEIKTEEHLSDGWRYLGIALDGDSLEDIYVDFNSPPQYFFRQCHTGNQVLPSPFPAGSDKIWRVSKMPGPRLVIERNDIKVIDFTFSDENCPDGNWRTYWRSDFKTIKFHDSVHEVSAWYRVAREVYKGSVKSLTLNTVGSDATINARND